MKDIHKWQALAEQRMNELHHALERISTIPTLMQAQRPPFHPGDILVSFGYTLSEASALLGPQPLTAYWPQIAASLNRACEQVSINAPGRVPTVVGLMALRVTMRNALVTEPVWPSVCDQWAMQLSQRPNTPDAHELLAAAWSAYALGDLPASYALLPQREIDPHPPRPPRDPTTRLMYLRAATTDNPTTILSWWHGLLDDFPMMIETQAMDWRLLQSIGHAYKSLISPNNTSTTAAWIHAAVQESVTSA